MVSKIILLISILIIGKLAFSQEVQCFVLFPPEKYFDNVKTISILDFSGEKGRVFADYLTTELLLENRGIKTVKGSGLFSSDKEGKTFQKGARTNVYSIAERSQLDKILQEQKLSNSGIIDDSQAAEIGKVLGIDAIVTGSVSYTSNDTQSQKEGTVDGRKVYSNCTIRLVTTEVRVKFISVKTGQIIGTKDTKFSYTDEACDEKRSGLASSSSLADYCLKEIAFTLANYFSPSFKLCKYEFEKIKVKEFKDKAKDVSDYLKDEDFNSAYSFYKAVYDADSYNALAARNIGNIYDIFGNYEKAQEYWKIAAEIDPKTYQPIIQWVDKEIEMNKTLIALGINIEKVDFTVKSDVLADKVKTRGSKSDRYEVKIEPTEKSDVITKVPGETEFTVIKKDGDWILIKLLGGKQGYIYKDFVK